QWGDEGKGKIIDFYVNKFDYDLVIRGQGGSNAGHTLILEDNQKIVLRLLPTGIVNPRSLCIIGQGTVIDPSSLVKEIEQIIKLKIPNLEISNRRLLISERAHLTMPWHRLYDRQNNLIGTTGNGIGPTYAAKALREGLRIGDFVHHPKVAFDKMQELKTAYQKNFTVPEVLQEFEKMYSEYQQAIQTLIKTYGTLVTDTHPIVQNYLQQQKNILLEGAQGVLLDLEVGTYPFVTSSNTTFSGLCAGAGVPPKKVDKAIGVFKAYTTRVGSGPFPTEDNSEYGQKIQDLGQEFGSVTGRKRRCGHLDLVLLKYACDLCGFDQLIMTKFDILENFDEMKICHTYEDNMKYPPLYLERAVPQYRHFANPKNKSENIIRYIEEYLGVKIEYLSLGPKRD
ncbi:MAG: adenylosuccinate synthetase, partial [Oligoflexia bacterium]|nr:adenylosuccinate synthetase [Oligoflexia bacterium]